MAVAVWIYGLQIGYALVVNCLVLRTLNITPTEYAGSFVPQWCVALAAAALVALARQFAPVDPPPAVEIVLMGVSYVVVFCTLAKMLLGADLLQLSRVAPRPIAGVMTRVLRLPRLEN